MRVSAEPESPNYQRGAIVSIDGRWCPFAIEADDVEGWVDTLDFAAVIPCNLPRVWPRKRVTGDVRIHLADDDS